MILNRELFRKRAALSAIIVIVSIATSMKTSAAPQLTSNGEAQAAIYMPATMADANDKKILQAAVTDFIGHIRMMSGATLAVQETDDAKTIRGPALVLDSLALSLGAEPAKTSLSKEGFRLLTKGDLLLVGGQSAIAVRHGLYEILYRLGCDWVMPGEIGLVMPRQPTITLPGFDESQAPDFAFRRLWYRGYPQPRKPEEHTRMRQWLEHQKGGDWTPAAANTAGHNWDALVSHNKQLFADNPDLLALVRMPDGTMQRRGPQIEASDPRIAALYADNIRKTYEKNIAAGKWTKETPAGFPIGPADGLGYSLSAEAMMAGSGRIDPIVGEIDRTDELILLGNRILEAVTPDYPNAMVGFYSYSTHADYPARYKPHPNIVVIFAPINFSRFHALTDTTSKTQPYYRDVVLQWAKLAAEQGNTLIYRGYNWNLADNMLPYTKTLIWGEELPFYKRNHIIGLNVEATKSWSILAASDYIFMRLAWNTALNWRDLLKEFCDKAYGQGAPAMLRYHTRLAERQRDAGQEAGSYHAFHLIYDDAWVDESRREIAAATAAAATEAEKTRIGFTAHNIEAMAIYLAFHKAVSSFDFAAANERYADMMAHWQKGYDENSDMVANEVPQYLKRFMGSFVEQALKYSNAPYTMAYRIPDELPTLLDPLATGHKMGFQNPGINDAQAMRTRTFSTTWDAQGLAGMRDGAVWYRIHFTLPANTPNEPVGLFIGGVEDEVRVWINGASVGTSGRAFSLPALFDLTGNINRQGPNLLALQVVRNSKANEIGLGGILRPCYIFTGPRLETVAPRELRLRRVLPGGELGEIEP